MEIWEQFSTYITKTSLELTHNPVLDMVTQIWKRRWSVTFKDSQSEYYTFIRREVGVYLLLILCGLWLILMCVWESWVFGAFVLRGNMENQSQAQQRSWKLLVMCSIHKSGLTIFMFTDALNYYSRTSQPLAISPSAATQPATKSIPRREGSRL